MNRPGIMIISLDFELYWGVFHRNSKSYEANLWGARQVIPKILDLFSKYGIHATWAIVGFLFFDNRTELLQALPALKPAYKNRHLSSYEHLQKVGADESSDPLHYAPSLIRAIMATPGQEIASHTFSHFYCLAEGQDSRAFRADLEANLQVARNWGIILQSIVFPKNMVNPEYLPICAELGFKAYRGNLAPSSASQSNFILRYYQKGLRLLDTYVNLTGSHTTPLPKPASDRLINIAGSMFLRPYNKFLNTLEPLRLRRVQKCLDAAAAQGHLFHLWWHPHNFGRHQDKNLGFLEAILKHYRKLNQLGRLVSLNMAEVTALREKMEG